MCGCYKHPMNTYEKEIVNITVPERVFFFREVSFKRCLRITHPLTGPN